jgi:hypothetical protein
MFWFFDCLTHSYAPAIVKDQFYIRRGVGFSCQSAESDASSRYFGVFSENSPALPGKIYRFREKMFHVELLTRSLRIELVEVGSTLAFSIAGPTTSLRLDKNHRPSQAEFTKPSVAVNALPVGRK